MIIVLFFFIYFIQFIKTVTKKKIRLRMMESNVNEINNNNIILQQQSAMASSIDIDNQVKMIL